MQILNEEDIGISGFASIRERVLIQDRNFFSHNMADACWDGFGGCIYLGNLWITLHSAAHVLPVEIGKAAIEVNDGAFTKSPTQPDRLAACARRGFAKKLSSVLQLFDVTRYACKSAPWSDLFRKADAGTELFRGSLANAWFKARGQTGLHHHRDVDIISLIPRGCILHQGSLGDAQTVNAGQVQIQRDGAQGFSHNEINPNNDIQPMLQMWIKPGPHAPAAQYHIQNIEPGLSCVYGGNLFPAQTSVYTLHWPQGGEINITGQVLFYIVSGEAEISENGIKQTVKRGDLVKGTDMDIRAQGEMMGLLVSKSLL